MLYACGVCERLYKTSEEALVCESVGRIEALDKVGDRIVIEPRYDPMTEVVIKEVFWEGHDYYYITSPSLSMLKDCCEGSYRVFEWGIVREETTSL